MRNRKRDNRSDAVDFDERHTHRIRIRQVGTWTGTVTTSGGEGWERCQKQKDDVDGLVPPRTWVPGLAWLAFGGGGSSSSSSKQQHLKVPATTSKVLCTQYSRYVSTRVGLVSVG